MVFDTFDHFRSSFFAKFWLYFVRCRSNRWRYFRENCALLALRLVTLKRNWSHWPWFSIDQFCLQESVLSRLWIWNLWKARNKMMMKKKEVIQRMNQSNRICPFTLMFHPKNVYFNREYLFKILPVIIFKLTWLIKTF